MDDASAHLLLLHMAGELGGDEATAKSRGRRLRLALALGRLLGIFFNVRCERGRDPAAADL